MNAARERELRKLREQVPVLEMENATLRGRVYDLDVALRRAERELGELRQDTQYRPSPYAAGWGGE